MKKSVLAAGLLAAVATLSACGQSAVSGSGSPAGGSGGTAPATGGATPQAKSDAMFSDAAAASLKAGTAKMSSTTEADTGGQTLPVMSGSGAIDFANHRSTMQMNMPSGPDKGAGGKIVYVMDGSIEYMQMGVGGDGPAPWIKVDLSKLTGQQGAVDYSNYLSLMSGVADSSEVGSEDIRGTATTHYKVSVDPKKVLEKNPNLKDFYDSLTKLADKVAPGSAAGALDTMPYDLWISKDGLLQRIQSMTKSTSEGKQVSAKMTIEFFDYGQPVDIKIPSPDEVKGN